MTIPLDDAAPRLIADLMPIAIVVADAGTGTAAAWRDAFGQAGAGADILDEATEPGFDLAVLLARPDPAGQDQLSGLVARLAEICDRLLFVPVPLPADGAPDLDAWFELFAEQGYQPVVDYDAGFLGQGAFLVDRNATAAETELAAFADRLSLGGALAASTQRVAVLEAEAGEREAMKAELAARRAEQAAVAAREAAWRGRAEAAEAELAALREELAGWRGMAQALGRWVRVAAAAPERNAVQALRAARGAVRRGWLARRGPSAAERAILADAALIRGSSAFEADYYIACHPGVAASGADPVLHYVLHGEAEGAAPGPGFDSAAYRAAHPNVTGNLLAHAIRHNHVSDAPRRD
jgi:hypothetical protein